MGNAVAGASRVLVGTMDRLRGLKRPIASGWPRRLVHGKPDLKTLGPLIGRVERAPDGGTDLRMDSMGRIRVHVGTDVMIGSRLDGEVVRSGHELSLDHHKIWKSINSTRTSFKVSWN